MKEIINKKLIVFESNPDFSDNSRGLWEYVNNSTDYETYWVIHDNNIIENLRSRNIACGQLNSIEANEMIAKAQYLVTSSFEFAYYKKADQIHVSAWHGFPLKLIGFFDGATAEMDENYYNNLKVITTQSDLVTATSRLSQLTMSGLLALDPRKVKDTGFPRNDLMFKYNGKELLKKITDIDFENSKLIFYLPTMRKGLKNEGSQFNDNIFNYSDYNPNELDSFLERQNAYIFCKLHFADNNYYAKENFNLPRRVIFINTEILNKQLLSIYHLMNAFDILISDYSSIYVDYLLLDRPIIFSCPDILKYKKDRGFIVNNPIDLMPGAFVNSQSSLLNTIESILQGNDEAAAVRKEKINLFHTYIDDNSSKRVFNEMLKIFETGGVDSNKNVGKLFLPYETPLYQYMLKARAEFYFDIGEGFNETSKKVIDYDLKIDGELVVFNVHIPKNTINIRFDPDELGKWILVDFSVLVDDKVAMYHIISGEKIDNKIYLTNKDPQIHIDLENKCCEEIKISYRCFDLYANINSVVKEANFEISLLKRDLSDIKLSRSWKITKPLRKCGSCLRLIKKKFKLK